MHHCPLPVLLLLCACSDAGSPALEGFERGTLDRVHLFSREPDTSSLPRSVLPPALLTALAQEVVVLRAEVQEDGRWGLVKGSKPPEGYLHLRAPYRFPFVGEPRITTRAEADDPTAGRPFEPGQVPGVDEIALGPQRVEVIQPKNDPWPTKIPYAYASQSAAVLEALCGGRLDEGQSPFTLELERGARRVLFAPVPASLTWRVVVPPAGRLHLGFGLRRLSYAIVEDGGLVVNPGAGGAAGAGTGLEFEFRVVVQEADRAPQVLWSRTLDGNLTGRFLDAHVDLAAYAGRTLELRLETAGASPAAGPLPFWAEPLLDGKRLLDADRPNIVVVLIDTLRADRLGCYGGERAGLTPHMDALAARGVRFDDTMAAGPCTLPSHASLFSSLYGSQHGVFFRERLPDEVVTMAEVLRAGGYQTHAQTEGFFVHHEFGLAQGFDTFSIGPRGVQRTVEAAQARLRATRGPFFLFLHTYEVHIPFTPPDAYRERWVRSYDGPYQGVTKSAQLKQGDAPIGERDVRYLRDLYDAEIAHADHWVGQFLQFMERQGWMDDTLLIVTSDHGEEFYEHGDFGHGRSLYREQLRVPLILFQKGVYEGGLVVEHTVHGVDLAPTLVAAAGLRAPSAWRGAVLSVQPPQTDRPLFTPFRTLVHDSWAAAWRVGDMKLITYHRGPGEVDPLLDSELYDLAQDPGEQDDLWGSGADQQRDARWIEHLADRFAEYPLSIEAQAVHASHEEEIQGLGYAGDE